MSAFGTYLYTYASLCLSALVLCSGIFLISCLAVRKRSGVSPKRQALWFVTLWYLISLSMILFTTGHSGENDVNLYPLRSIYSAVADTRVSLSQLIVLTSGLFVPFGFLLMLVIRRRPLQYFIPLFSLVYALALEGLHLLFGYGAFDIDRPILGMLGALFGCGLCAKKCPVQAIEMRDGKPVWVKDKCVMCLGCLHRCPKYAYHQLTRANTVLAGRNAPILLQSP